MSAGVSACSSEAGGATWTRRVLQTAADAPLLVNNAVSEWRRFWLRCHAVLHAGLRSKPVLKTL